MRNKKSLSGGLFSLLANDQPGFSGDVTGKNNFNNLPMRMRSQEGAALVVVLALVVLLAALVVAFFSRALLERQISASSANQTKA
ncbi:MAG: hypothetical protein LBD30_03775, partial [Verrucomicrobiales bacterium]|nr:hypothetical protein [Verrucomicrobiales bacterium]